MSGFDARHTYPEQSDGGGGTLGAGRELTRLKEWPLWGLVSCPNQHPGDVANSGIF